MQSKIGTREQWLTARLELLTKEKEYTKLREEMARQRRCLPWVRMEKDYIFQDSAGDVSLAELFSGRSQLIVQHFMYGPDWEQGCPSCSLMADHHERIRVHLNQRDASLVVVSRAPVELLDKFKKRMGWTFRWVSSLGNDFNTDFSVSFPEGLENVQYNYGQTDVPSSEMPGMSVFARDDSGEIYNTYSCFARGLERFIGVYELLDILPKGRAEDDLPFPMAWVKLRDSYQKETRGSDCCS